MIGAFVRAAIWRLGGSACPGCPTGRGIFVVVAMMACFGSVSRAPLAVMIMVADRLVLVVPGAIIAVNRGTVVVSYQRHHLRDAATEPADRRGRTRRQ